MNGAPSSLPHGLSTSDAVDAVAVALIKAVAGTRSDAAHLATALGLYRRQMRSEGRAVPDSILALEKTFAAIWHRSPEVTGGHSGSIVAGLPPMGDGPVMPETLLDRRATARRMNCSPETVKRRERAGQLPAVRHGHIVGYRVADIDALLAAGTTPC